MTSESLSSATSRVERLAVQLAGFLRPAHSGELKLQYTGYGHKIGVCLFSLESHGSKTLVCAASGASREIAAAMLLRRLVDDARGFCETVEKWCAAADDVLAEKTQ